MEGKVNDNLRKDRSFHGGDIYSGDRKYLDLSSNINPRPLPFEVINSLPDILTKAKAYPDSEYRNLKTTISNYLNTYFLEEGAINKSHISLGNGAVDVIDKIISLFSRIIIIRPAFIEYSLSCQRYNKEIIFIDRDLESEYGILSFPTINKVRDRIIEDSLLVICNPNNPDGAIYDLEAVGEILKALREKNSYLLVDETFSDFIPKRELNALSLIKDFDNLIVVKALTKFFGLPGLRLGYSISKNINLNIRLEERQTTWNIGAFEENIAQILMGNRNFIEGSIKDNKENRDYLFNVLKDSQLFKRIFPSFSDFISLSLIDEVDEVEFKSYLEKDGILVRSLYNMEPFTKRDFRIAVKGKEASDRLKASLISFKNNKTRGFISGDRRSSL